MNSSSVFHVSAFSTTLLLLFSILFSVFLSFCIRRFLNSVWLFLDLLHDNTCSTMSSRTARETEYKKEDWIKIRWDWIYIRWDWIYIRCDWIYKMRLNINKIRLNSYKMRLNIYKMRLNIYIYIYKIWLNINKLRLNIYTMKLNMYIRWDWIHM